jgi:hypothetical protein
VIAVEVAVGGAGAGGSGVGVGDAVSAGGKGVRVSDADDTGVSVGGERVDVAVCCARRVLGISVGSVRPSGAATVGVLVGVGVAVGTAARQ